MSKNITFRFSTGILIRLGEELNPSLDHGILELVKNSYDADAHGCSVQILEAQGSQGTIVVTDDGHGMTEDEIINGWLVVGKSGKAPTRKTKLGRTPSGDKGLGRLAALRLGSTVKLRTVSAKNLHEELSIDIDWTVFETAALVENVPLSVTRTRSNKSLQSGTVIEIRNLRSAITRADVKRLARAMLLLADPFDDARKGFHPKLIAPEFEDLEKLVASKYFNDAEYCLVASTNKNGLSHAQVLDWRGEVLYSANHDEIRQDSDAAPYACPPITFEFWAFLLSKAAFATHNSTASMSEVRTWLTEFGGVHFYHSGLRVLPYGEPNDDWVGLNKMRAISPEERPSTNNSVGRIVVNQPHPDLVQKTDRSGFIENETFREIRRFAVDSLLWMARKRLEDAERRRAKDRLATKESTTKAKSDIENAIASLPQGQRGAIEEAYRRYDTSREREAERLRREVQLYRTLSTAGITAAVFAHESANNPIKVIRQSINTIERRTKEIKSDIYSMKLKEPIDRIMRSVESLSVLGSVTLSLIDHDKRRASKVDIHLVISQVVELFTPFIETRKTSLTTELAPGRPFLRGSIAALESIVTNLLNNSLAAFEGSPPGPRAIVIRTSVQRDNLALRVMDNGPGIVNIRKRDIWLPGETTKPHGTGLGLTIVRDAVADLGGTVDAVENGEMGGAEIVIEIPIIGINK